MPKRIDLAGQRFGRWLVRALAPSSPRRLAYECICDCGVVRVVSAGNLRGGLTRSCGCLKIEETVARSTKHGFGSARTERRPPEYTVWMGMRARCSDPGHPSYENYGGRGIAVCARWDDFALFLADVGHRPGRGYSLEREDNNKGYEPGNVHWATAVEQGRNKRNNRFLTMAGRTMTCSDWARETGIPPAQISNRLSKGWPVEKVLTYRRPYNFSPKEPTP